MVSTEEAAKKLNKPIGTYVTVDTGDIASGTVEADGAADILSSVISRFLQNEKSFLVVGLGNMTLTVDALGPLAAEGILATRHIESAFAESIGLTGLKSVSVLAPGVLGQTGMEAYEVIKAVCAAVRPEAVIVIDALAAAEHHRLGKTVQINNFGISPGSGVGNRRREISRQTLGVPVVAIGIPTVAATEHDSLIITSRECDLLTRRSAELIAHAVNFALQPAIGRDILLSLV